MELEREFLLYAEEVWFKNWRETDDFIQKKLLPGFIARYDTTTYTYEKTKKILLFLDSLIGYRIDDSFENERPHMIHVFQSSNVKYRFYLRCRHMHNRIQMRLSDYINPMLKINPTGEFKKKHFYMLLISLLQFPPLFDDH